jgi:hypothetical protein
MRGKRFQGWPPAGHAEDSAAQKKSAQAKPGYRLRLSSGWKKAGLVVISGKRREPLKKSWLA